MTPTNDETKRCIYCITNEDYETTRYAYCVLEDLYTYCNGLKYNCPSYATEAEND